MTDKEKRELKDGVISIFKNFNIFDHTATIGGLQNDILKYIDSLQEEPVSIDLKLSWEDIPKIFQISEELKTSWWFRDNEQTKQIGTQVFWEEVLKRFKETKGE